MKLLKFSFIFPIVLSIAFSACSNQSFSLSETTDDAIYEGYADVASAERFFYDMGGDSFGCIAGPGTCLPDLIVTAPRLQNKESASISALFANPSNNIETFKAFLPKKLAEGIDKKDLTTEFKTSQDSKTLYMIIKYRDKIVAVAPYTTEKKVTSEKTK